MIVRWRGHAPAGVVDSTTVITAVDLMPSLARLAGAEIVSEVELDGQDLSVALRGRPTARSRPIFWYFINKPWPARKLYLSPNYAVRDGKWKLLMNGDGSRQELYDLLADPAESNNVAALHPQITARLAELITSWRETLPPASRLAGGPPADWKGWR